MVDFVVYFLDSSCRSALKQLTVIVMKPVAFRFSSQAGGIAIELAPLLNVGLEHKVVVL